jgi:hypothetical protein
MARWHTSIEKFLSQYTRDGERARGHFSRIHVSQTPTARSKERDFMVESKYGNEKISEKSEDVLLHK